MSENFLIYAGFWFGVGVALGATLIESLAVLLRLLGKISGAFVVGIIKDLKSKQEK